jgi:dienelactone hydrolase
MLIHSGGWAFGDACDIVQVGNDIDAAGYFVVSVFHELAPPNYIPDQPSHEDDEDDPGWRMAQQVNDIKALVRALRADPRCNGKVGAVGGSPGATHAVTVALAGKTSRP